MCVILQLYNSSIQDVISVNINDAFSLPTQRTNANPKQLHSSKQMLNQILTYLLLVNFFSVRNDTSTKTDSDLMKPRLGFYLRKANFPVSFLDFVLSSLCDVRSCNIVGKFQSACPDTAKYLVHAA